MNLKHTTRRRAMTRSATPSKSKKRLKNDNVAIEVLNKSDPGDFDFFIDEIDSIPRSPKMVANLLDHSNRDQYCWVCDKDETDKFCYYCIRSFHNKCLHQIKKVELSANPPEKWRCPQCKELLNAKNDFQRRQVDFVKFNELLRFIVVRLYSHDEWKKFGTTFHNVLRSIPDVTIINPFDISLIEEKVNDSRYESITEFIVDIKWICHNCGIACKQNKSIYSQAKRMLRFCERELYDIEICSECYLGSNTCEDKKWFVNACERPHLLVWAKLKGTGQLYWPGKAVACRKDLVDVRFFGDQACAFVPTENVFLYSKLNPNKRMSAAKKSILDSYAEEINEYIANLNEKFSLFRFMPPLTKFEPEKIYIHLHQMLPYMYIEENGEYFRKMINPITRDPNQPEKLSIGYSAEGKSIGLRPLSVLMHRLKNGSASKNHQDDDETDVNDLADSLENSMNIKTESIRTKPIIDSDSDQSTIMIRSSDSEPDDDNETNVTMIEVRSIPETDQEQAAIDNNETHVLSSVRSDDQNQNDTSVQLRSVPENTSNVYKRSKEIAVKEPPIQLRPPSSMPIIDETDESVMHDEDAIASESGSIALNGTVSNVAATNTAIDDDEDWHEIKRLVRKKMEKEHRLEYQLWQQTLSAAANKLKLLKEKNKTLEKENDHWKNCVQDLNAKMREKDADFKKQSEENEETKKRLEIEYADKIEAIKIELNEQWRKKKWCTLCGKEIKTQLVNSAFCSFGCMRQSWLQNTFNSNQTNNNEDEINMDEIH